jgi:hypothetical protein
MDMWNLIPSLLIFAGCFLVGAGCMFYATAAKMSGKKVMFFTFFVLMRVMVLFSGIALLYFLTQITSMYVIFTVWYAWCCIVTAYCFNKKSRENNRLAYEAKSYKDYHHCKSLEKLYAVLTTLMVVALSVGTTLNLWTLYWASN